MGGEEKEEQESLSTRDGGLPIRREVSLSSLLVESRGEESQDFSGGWMRTQLQTNWENAVDCLS